MSSFSRDYFFVSYVSFVIKYSRPLLVSKALCDKPFLLKALYE